MWAGLRAGQRDLLSLASRQYCQFSTICGYIAGWQGWFGIHLYKLNRMAYVWSNIFLNSQNHPILDYNLFCTFWAFLMIFYVTLRTLVSCVDKIGHIHEGNYNIRIKINILFCHRHGTASACKLFGYEFYSHSK